MSLHIRTATHGDLETVLALARVLHQESRFRSYPLSQDKMEKAVLQLIDSPGRILLLAQYPPPGGNGEPVLVGMMGAYLSTLFFSDVVVAQERAFYVHPEHRGGPAALKLMIAFRRWAEKQQAVEINVNMSSAIDIEGFNRLMSRLGFSCCGSNFTLAL